jgi:hypothetical protein
MMKVYSRRQLMSFKPYDAEIEYIENDSASYINTGVKGSSNVTFDIKMYLPSSSISFWLFGSRVANGDRQLGLLTDKGYNHVSWRFGNKDAAQAPRLSNGIYTFKNTAKANIITFSNRSIICTNNTFTSNIDFYILAMNSSGTINSSISGTRIYYAKIFESGILIRDFIPVRVGNVGYLYDKVSKKLFGNAGTGSFILGLDK